MIQPKYGLVPCATLKKAEEKIRVECPFKDLNEVKKPISLTANAFLISKENKGDKVVAKAKVVFTLIYLSEDGYQKATCDVDAEVELGLENAQVHVLVSDVKLVTSNGYVGVCTVVFKGEATISDSLDVLVGGDGICTKTNEIVLDMYNEVKKGKHDISDEFTLDFIVGEVLSYKANAYLNSVVSAIGRIILEGDVVLTLKALPFSENNDIVKERRVIPFRYELEDVDALQGERAYAVVDVGATHLKVLSDEGKERSNVAVDVTLEFFGGTVSKENLYVAEDAFLKYNECELKKTSFEIATYCGQKTVSEKVVCKGSKAAEGCKIVSVLGEDLSVIAVKQTADKVQFDGVVKVDVVFKNADNGIVVAPCECPLSIDFAVDGKIDISRAVLTDVTAKIRNDEIEFECHLKLYYKEYNLQTINCLEDVLELGLRNNLDGAICICIGKKGDSLWDVAKKLAIDEQEVLKFNSNLQFPLEEDDRLIVYRQKL